MTETQEEVQVNEQISENNQDTSMEETPYFNTEDENALSQLLGRTQSTDDKNEAGNNAVPEAEPLDDTENTNVDENADESDDDEDSEDDNFDVCIKSTKLGPYKTGNTYQARSLQATIQGMLNIFHLPYLFLCVLKIISCNFRIEGS